MFRNLFRGPARQGRMGRHVPGSPNLHRKTEEACVRDPHTILFPHLSYLTFNGKLMATSIF